MKTNEQVSTSLFFDPRPSDDSRPRPAVYRWCRSLLLVGALSLTVSACSSDRFDGQTEQEMFATMQTELCELVNRCGVLWDNDNPPESVSDAECKGGFDDDRHYKEPIDDATRESLNVCLDAIEDAECEALVPKLPVECEAEGVAKLLDLK